MRSTAVTRQESRLTLAVRGDMTGLATNPASRVPALLEEYVFSENFEVRLVGRQRKHNQIRVLRG
jgi:hypothetical protein